MTRKWIGVNDLSSGTYSVNMNIRFEKLMLRSNLGECRDAYIVVKGTITVDGTSANNQANERLGFKNNSI